MAKALARWAPKELSETHKLMATLFAAGWKNKEVSEELGISESRVSVIRNDPRVQVIVEQYGRRFRDETARSVKERITRYSDQAVETVNNLMLHAESETVRLTAAKDLLDRAGHKPRENVNLTSVSFEGGDIMELVRTLKEARTPEQELEFVQDTSGVFVQKTEVHSARR